MGSLRRPECCGIFQNGFFSPHPTRNRRAFFSDSLCDNPVDFLEVQLSEVWAPLMTLSPWISRICPCWASNNSSISSGFLTPVLGPLKVSTQESLLWQVMSLCVHLFASPILGAAILPVGFSLMVMEGSGACKIVGNNCSLESSVMVLIKGLTVTEQKELPSHKMCWVWMMGCESRVL